MFNYEYDYKDLWMDHLQDEMQKQKKQALIKFASIVSDSNSVDAIARLVASGSLEENPDALKIIDNLNIDKLEVFSVLENEDLFKDQYVKEMQWAYDSDVYYAVYGG